MTVASRDFRLAASIAADGFLLIDSFGQRVGYLSHDNLSCAVGEHAMNLMVGGRRFGWELVLSDHQSGRRIAVAWPRLRPGAFRIVDGSKRKLRLRRGVRVGHWTVLSDRGQIARIIFSELMRSTRASLRDWDDERTAVDVVLVDESAKLANVGPIVLLAIATVRAEMSIPFSDISPAG